jgi:16S rRNA processing protein RimM
MAFETSVTHVKRTATGFIVGLADVTTREAAARWRGAFIQTPRGVVSALPDGTYYSCDLIGLTVRTEQGDELGRLEQVWELPGSHVFVVRQGSNEILIPAVREWVQAVDVEGRVMTVRVLASLEKDHAAI